MKHPPNFGLTRESRTLGAPNPRQRPSPSHRLAPRATKRDGSAAWAGLQPGKPARAPLNSKSEGRKPTRERGRPARMHSRCVPLSFPAMGHRATLPAGTEWLGRSRVLAPLWVDPGTADGRGCARTCAGGTPALPGGLHPMTSSQQRRSIGIRVYSCSFVVRLQQPSAVSSSNHLAGRPGVSDDLEGAIDKGTYCTTSERYCLSEGRTDSPHSRLC